MADTRIEVNGKCVGEYDICDNPCVKFVNGSGPDDCGNVKVDGGGPTINGGYDVVTPLAPIEENITSGELFANAESIWDVMYNNVGSTINITFDGVPYQCVIKDSSGYVPYVVGDTNFVEFPFYIVANILVDADPMCQVRLYTASAGESHTVKIQVYESAPVVFDKKYIPSMDVLTDTNSSYITTGVRYIYTLFKRSDGYFMPSWDNCEADTDIFTPIQFRRTIDPNGVSFNFYESKDTSYSFLTANASRMNRLVATCVVSIAKPISDGGTTYEVYFASKTKVYNPELEEDKRGILFTFVSLYDSSDKFELFLKSNGNVVEGDPNATTEP